MDAASALTALFMLGAQSTEPGSFSQGKIVLYRSSAVLGYAVGCPIRYKGRKVVNLGRSKYAEWAVGPGRYILTNKSSSVEVAVNPGETRFVRCLMKPGAVLARADLQIVDRETFSEHEADYQRIELVDALTSVAPGFSDTP